MTDGSDSDSNSNVTPSLIDELALQEARSALAEQVEALERLRTRSTAYVATVLAVSGFVVGDRPTGDDGCAAVVLAVLALLATVAAATLAAVILWPRSFKFSQKADLMVQDDAWRVEKNPSGQLARYLSEHATSNGNTLGWMHKMFSVQIAVGAGAIVLWLIQSWL